MMPIEIPQQGWLVLATAATGGAARFRITVGEEGAAAKALLDEKQEAGSVRERRLDLAEFAGKLVALEFAVAEGRPGDAVWIAPRILLPKTKAEEAPVCKAEHPLAQTSDNLPCERDLADLIFCHARSEEHMRAVFHQ